MIKNNNLHFRKAKQTKTKVEDKQMAKKVVLAGRLPYRNRYHGRNLKHNSCTGLGAIVIKEALKRAGVARSS